MAAGPALVVLGLGLGLVPDARADTGDLTVLDATVIAPDGSRAQASVTLDELLAAPGACPVYPGPYDVTDNAPDGRTTGVSLDSNDAPDQGSWSLASALGCLTSGGSPAPVDAAAAQAVVVIGADGQAESSRSSLLSGSADFSTPSDFADPAQVPVISAQDPGQNPLVQYNRPARSAGDVDYSDLISGAAPISVDVYEGQNPISVTITRPASTTVTAGTALRFSARVSGGSGSAAYAWSFDGGAPSATTTAPSVTFTTAGVYDVGLQITDAAGDVGQAQPIRITVTSRSTPAHAGTTPQGTTTHPSGTGTGATGAVSGAGHGGGRVGGRGGAPQTTTNPTLTGTGTPTSTATGPGTPTGTGTSTGTGTGSPRTSTGTGRRLPARGTSTGTSPNTPRPVLAPTPGGPAPSARSPIPREPVRVPSPGARRRRISGLLISQPLSGARLVPHGSSGSPTAAGRPVALRAGADAGPLGIIAGAAIAVLLLGLGVMRELVGPLTGSGRGHRPGSGDV